MEELDNIDNNNKNKEENLDSPKVFINNAQILESGQILITPPKPDEKTFEDWKRTSDEYAGKGEYEKAIEAYFRIL
ncbi:hypothetical protein [uncultured Brachyspira sp.]|nr:hypothetical protein [uncultured Brachyspira sp.]